MSAEALEGLETMLGMPVGSMHDPAARKATRRVPMPDDPRSGVVEPEVRSGKAGLPGCTDRNATAATWKDGSALKTSAPTSLTPGGAVPGVNASSQAALKKGDTRSSTSMAVHASRGDAQPTFGSEIAALGRDISTEEADTRISTPQATGAILSSYGAADGKDAHGVPDRTPSPIVDTKPLSPVSQRPMAPSPQPATETEIAERHGVERCAVAAPVRRIRLTVLDEGEIETVIENSYTRKRSAALQPIKGDIEPWQASADIASNLEQMRDQEVSVSNDANLEGNPKTSSQRINRSNPSMQGREGTASRSLAAAENRNMLSRKEIVYDNKEADRIKFDKKRKFDRRRTLLLRQKGTTR